MWYLMEDKSDFRKALKFTLVWEGGYVNNPSDKGGATNKGITQGTYDSYRTDNKLPVRSVQAITNLEVEDIYWTRYWLAAHCNEMTFPLCAAVFDTSVNFGAVRAIKFVQEALAVKIDGRYGAETSAAVQKADPHSVAPKICDLRIARRYGRVQEDPSQRIFLAGWLNRDRALKKFVGKP